jgi:hypothetical protein
MGTMARPEPLALLVGESITVDPAGNAFVHRAIDTITADAFPHTFRPFTIFCRCRFTTTGEAQVWIERPDGTTLHAFEPMRVEGTGEGQQVHTVTGLVFPAPGDYRVVLGGPRDPLATAPLAVRMRN